MGTGTQKKPPALPVKFPRSEKEDTLQRGKKRKQKNLRGQKAVEIICPARKARQCCGLVFNTPVWKSAFKTTAEISAPTEVLTINGST